MNLCSEGIFTFLALIHFFVQCRGRASLEGHSSTLNKNTYKVIKHYAFTFVHVFFFCAKNTASLTLKRLLVVDYH